MKNANKPVIMEEFGITNSSTRPTVYTEWYSTVISTGLTGDLIWCVPSLRALFRADPWRAQ